MEEVEEIEDPQQIHQIASQLSREKRFRNILYQNRATCRRPSLSRLELTSVPDETIQLFSANAVKHRYTYSDNIAVKPKSFFPKNINQNLILEKPHSIAAKPKPIAVKQLNQISPIQKPHKVSACQKSVPVQEIKQTFHTIAESSILLVDDIKERLPLEETYKIAVTPEITVVKNNNETLLFRAPKNIARSRKHALVDDTNQDISSKKVQRFRVLSVSAKNCMIEPCCGNMSSPCLYERILDGLVNQTWQAKSEYEFAGTGEDYFLTKMHSFH